MKPIWAPLFAATGMLVSTTQGGQALYAIGNEGGDGSSELFRIDNYSSTPTAIPIGKAGVKLFDVAVDSTSGRIYALNDASTFYEVNSTSGVAVPVGPMGVSGEIALVFDRTGQAFCWGYINRNLYKVNKVTGAATLVGDTGFTSGGGLAFDVDGTLYGSTGTQLIRINATNGVGTLVGSFGTTGVFGLAIDTDSAIYAAAGDNTTGGCELYRVNKSTGLGTLISPVSGASAYSVYGLSFAIAPGTILLSIAPNPAGVKLGWNSQTNKLYRLQSRPSLTEGRWLSFGSLVLGNGSTNYVTNSITADSTRSYRITEQAY